MQAVQEDLGDLKLYRIPEPVTVAARSQKQVALLQRSGDPGPPWSTASASTPISANSAPAQRVLVTRNRAAEGLGLPLPGGPPDAVLRRRRRARSCSAQGTIRDRAVGEDVEIELGPAPGVMTALRLVSRDISGRDYELVVTNDRAQPVRFEGEIAVGALDLRPAATLGSRDGMPLWTVTVPANGSATLRYRVSASRR